MSKGLWYFLFIVISPLIGILIGGITFYVLPRQYDSTVILEVRPMLTSMQVISGEGPSSGALQSMPAEPEIIRSRYVFDLVMDRLDLTKVWGVSRDSAYDNFQKIIHSEHLRGTNLIKIRVRTVIPSQSKQIAKAVGESYLFMRWGEEKEQIESAMTEIRDAVRSQEDTVDEHSIKLHRILNQYEASLLPSEANATSPEEAKISSESKRLYYNEAKLEYESELRHLEKLKIQLTSIELQYAVSQGPVMLRKQPTQATLPSSPNAFRCLILGASGGLLFGLFVSLLSIPFFYVSKKQEG